MPSFSYTNNIQNGDSLDASKVMQNFNDVRGLLVTTKLDADNIANGAITDTQIATGANITSTKIALTDGKIVVGNSSNVAAAVTPTGDVTITNAGVTAIGSLKVTNAMLAGSIAYSKLTLTSSLLNADVSASAAIDYSKLAAMTTGKILLGNAGTPTATTLGGDATVGATGTLTVQNISGLTTSTKTTTYAILSTDTVVYGDATSAAFTMTLPTAVGATGKVYYLGKTDSSVNALTIATTSSQTIDGSTTVKIYNQYQVYKVVSDGTNWVIQAIKPGKWQTWTPTLANLTKGNGTVTASFLKVGTMVDMRFNFTLGSTSAVATGGTFTLPITNDTSQNSFPCGIVTFIDDSAGTGSTGKVDIDSTGIAKLWPTASDQSYSYNSSLTSSAPFTWAISDKILCTGRYEAASLAS